MNYKRKNKAEALTQIFILVVGIIAISWMIGSEVREVSAADETPCTLTHCVGTMIYGSKRNADGMCVDDNSPSGLIKNCPNGCSAGICKASFQTSTTTNKVSCSRTCSYDNKYVWTQKADSSGKCGLDTQGEFCVYGCDGGFCKSKGDTTDFAGGLKKGYQGITSVVGTVGSIKGTTDFVKGLANKATKETTKKLADGSVQKVTEEVVKNGFFHAWKTFLFGEQVPGEIAGETVWSGVGGASGGAFTAATSILVWAGIAFLFGRYVIGNWFNLSTHNAQTVGYALAFGTTAGLLLTSKAIMGASSIGGPAGIAIGAAVAAVTMLFMWKNAAADVIQLPCYQWEAQTGKAIGDAKAIKARCEMCNKNEDLPCTEYQCRSLGAGCELVNEEDSGRQLCIWKNPSDITAPTIEPLKEALLDDFDYTPDKAVSPPDRGVKIVYTGKEQVTIVDGMKCATPYTRVSFGVKLDEAAKCKISTVKQSSYDKMGDIFMGRGIRDYNHSFILSLPSKEALEAQNITVDNGKTYDLFVRCEDANGNTNPANFVFKFCISDGPDTTAPKILGTSYTDNEPISSGKKFIDDLYLYVNEPSTCRWSFADKSYETMENNLTCQTDVTEINSQLSYNCKANLTGLKDNQPNKFYFRCKDKPFLAGTAKESERNANRASYSLNLIGTKPLVIDKVGPNDTIIEDSTNVIKVELTTETLGGYKDGGAICSFSETGTEGSYVDFFYEYDIEPYTQYAHTQELWLSEGIHNYFIRCIDKGGNSDTEWINFSVKTDTTPPTVVRVYNEEGYLKVITDEPATCVYSEYDCKYIFEEGETMNEISDAEFYADWDINTNYYIKCKDKYGNMPKPSECNIVARPFEIFETEEN